MKIELISIGFIRKEIENFRAIGLSVIWHCGK